MAWCLTLRQPWKSQVWTVLGGSAVEKKHENNDIVGPVVMMEVVFSCHCVARLGSRLTVSPLSLMLSVALSPSSKTTPLGRPLLFGTRGPV